MRTSRFSHLTGLTLLAIAAIACSSSPKATEPAATSDAYKESGAAAGGLVNPLKDDSSADVLSWVDGKPVTDWTAEIAKRDRAIDSYLNDADPKHAEAYGFRSGQNPR